jgi:hypothetical protein
LEGFLNLSRRRLIEITRHRHVSDATFETLRKYFNEREIVEIMQINAIENYHNLINIPLKMGSDGFCAIAGGADVMKIPFSLSVQLSASLSGTSLA